ncbi:MAG: hypothetical protein ACRDOL_01690 [Streptosporangiaceae bacterium]
MPTRQRRARNEPSESARGLELAGQWGARAEPSESARGLELAG